MAYSYLVVAAVFLIGLGLVLLFKRQAGVAAQLSISDALVVGLGTALVAFMSPAVQSLVVDKDGNFTLTKGERLINTIDKFKNVKIDNIVLKHGLKDLRLIAEDITNPPAVGYCYYLDSILAENGTDYIDKCIDEELDNLNNNLVKVANGLSDNKISELFDDQTKSGFFQSKKYMFDDSYSDKYFELRKGKIGEYWKFDIIYSKYISSYSDDSNYYVLNDKDGKLIALCSSDFLSEEDYRKQFQGNLNFYKAMNGSDDLLITAFVEEHISSCFSKNQTLTISQNLSDAVALFKRLGAETYELPVVDDNGFFIGLVDLDNLQNAAILEILSAG